jgi:hypothetical protein
MGGNGKSMEGEMALVGADVPELIVKERKFCG